MNGLRADLHPDEEILFGLRRTRERPRPAPPPAQSPIARGIAGLRQQAERDRAKRFTLLLHHVDVELLEDAYRRLKSEGARGGGGRTWTEYGRRLRANTVRLYTRLQHGRHRTLPSWRRLVALAQGRRPQLKRAALKDRIVQRAVALVLAALYEPHLRNTCRGLAEELLAAAAPVRARWVVETPLEALTGRLPAKTLLRVVGQRVGDSRLLDLLRRWIRAGLLEEGAPAGAAAGGGHLSTLAALLTEVYFHYTFDAWAERWRERHARSAVILARDRARFLAAFEHKPGARRFQLDLRVRLRQLLPSLPPKKVRLLGFSRHARAPSGGQHPPVSATPEARPGADGGRRDVLR